LQLRNSAHIFLGSVCFSWKLLAQIQIRRSNCKSFDALCAVPGSSVPGDKSPYNLRGRRVAQVHAFAGRSGKCTTRGVVLKVTAWSVLVSGFGCTNTPGYLYLGRIKRLLDGFAIQKSLAAAATVMK
jgi:hypothetical protein